jgi:heat shock protein 1/8
VIFKNGIEETLAYSDGHRTLPTLVAYDESSVLFGHEAKQQQGRNAKYTISNLKRLLGKPFNDESVQKLITQLPFTVREFKDNTLAVEIYRKGKTETILFEDIVSTFFKKLRETAEQNLGEKVTKVILSVSPSLTHNQKSTLIKAAEKASLKVLKLVSDPICAAIAYNFDCSEENTSLKKFLVIDFGSDLDISVVASDNGFLSVLHHDTLHIGGDDLDDSLVHSCIEEFHKKNKTHTENIQFSQRVLHKLKLSCENAKKVLSQRNDASVEVDSIYEGRDFVMQVTRARWESINESHFRKISDHIQKVLADTKITEDNSLSAIICVGSGCKIPKIKTLIGTISNATKYKIPILDSINPETVVLRGLAIEASLVATALSEFEEKTQQATLCAPYFIDVTSLSVGTLRRIIDSELVVTLSHKLSIVVKDWKMLVAYLCLSFQKEHLCQ